MDDIEEYRSAEKWELLGCADEEEYWNLESDARKDKEFYSQEAKNVDEQEGTTETPKQTL